MNFQNNKPLNKRIVQYGIIAILLLPLASPLFLAPFGLFLFPDSFSKAIFFRVIVEILFLAGMYSILMKGTLFRMQKLSWIFLFLWLIMGLSTLLSLEPHQSMWDLQYRSLGFFFYSHLFIFLFLAIYFIKTQKLWDRIFKIIISVGGIVSLIGILQWFGVYIKPDYISVTSLSRPGATLGNPNTFGAYLVIIIPLTFLYFVKSVPYVGGLTSHIRYGVVWGVILILEIIGLVATSSRAAILGLVAFAIIFSLIYPFKKLIIKKIILGVLAFLIVFSITGILFGFLNDIMIFGRFSRLLSSSGSTRLIAWQSGIKSFFSRPILGFGLENFAIAFDRNYNPFFGTIPGLSEHWWGRAHNFIVEWLTGIGVVGFTFYALVYAYIISTLNKFKNKSRDTNLKITAPTLIALFGGYLTFNFFNFDVPINLILIFIIFGYAHFIIYKENEGVDSDQCEYKSQLSITRYAFIPLTIGVIFLLWNYNIKPLLINVKANEIETRFFSDPEKSFNDYLKILEKSSYIDHDLNLRFYYNGQQYTNWLLSNGYKQKAVEQRKIFIEKLENNLKIKPYYTRNHIYLADSYAYLLTLDPENKPTNFTNAKNHYSKATELSPLRQEGHLGLAQLYRSVGQYDKSISILKEIIETNSEYGPAHFWLAINYFYQDKIKEGTEELKRAVDSHYELPMDNLKIIFKDKPEILRDIIENVNQ